MSNSDYYEPITMDELFELKELSAKLMKFTEKELAYRQDISYENFNYTPRSISAFNRAVTRRECDQIPFPNTWEFIDSLPLDEESVAKFEGRKQLHKYLSLNVIKFVVRLYYISGMTQREIAAHVGPRNTGHQWSQPTVNSRLKALRKIVGQHICEVTG